MALFEKTSELDIKGISNMSIILVWYNCLSLEENVEKAEKNWILKPKLLEIKKKRFFVLLWIYIYLFLPCKSFLKIAFNISIVTVLKLQLIPLSFLLARLQIIFKFALKFVRLVTNFQTALT